MSDQLTPEAALLSRIGGGALCWIRHGSTDATSFEGRAGWLRFQSTVVASKSLARPPQEAGALLSGEWVIDGRSSARASTENGALIVRMITETASAADGARPVLRRRLWTMMRGFDDGRTARYWSGPPPRNERFLCHVYFGFRTDDDAAEGRLTPIVDRFAGFDSATLDTVIG